jgi:hypothetical protein
MKLFQCSVCAQVLFFENARCTKCGHALAYLPDASLLVPVETDVSGETANEFVVRTPKVEPSKVRVCKNYSTGACNWAFPADEQEEFCRSCRLTAIIPNLDEAEFDAAWRRLEAAKRRLLYTLYALRLPVESKAENQQHGLSFAFMKDENPNAKVLTGHNDGLITINVAEADDSFREKMRKSLGEAYRTLLGHLRHESGHYYWERLVRDTEQFTAFRNVFGDESVRYDEALARHYEGGPPGDWPTRFVSAYAAMHPWEDFAETWAHYLHMVDTLETAHAHGLAARPALSSPPSELRLSTALLDFHDFGDLMKAWVPLTLAVNDLNRSMGLGDAYPFVLSKIAIEKLSFVHNLIEKSALPSRQIR